MTLISVVTGTYNRLALLQSMIASVRCDMLRGTAYEIVVVDGGSTDGTLEWCHKQPDVHLIEHGALLGAIKAFCDGAKAAQGDYVLLANDDVEFFPNSILQAVSYLETTPTCGAVAFADNRTAQVTGGNADTYRVEGIGVTTVDGQRTMKPYAQVGMFRRWLGNEAGWWGADDPVMNQSRTYGGDSYLSARIWEMGYSVDAVGGCKVRDLIARDDLRKVNAAQGPLDSKAYYTRFPTVQLRADPAMPNPQEDRLRVMYLPVYESGYPGRMNKDAGMGEALAKMSLCIELDYLNEPYDMVELARVWQPDLVLTQIQGAGEFNGAKLAAIRQAAPHTVIVNWNGDAHEWGLIAPDVLSILQHVDLQTTINAKVLPIYEQLHIPAAYWQIGFKDPAGEIPDMPTHDVLFQGNCYNEHRDALVKRLRAIPGIRVATYGNCAGSVGNTHYDFAAQRALYHNARITVGDTFPGTKAFVSNRVFQALSAGAFLLQQYSEALEEYTGLKDGVHYVMWRDLDDLEAKIIEWMRSGSKRKRNKIAKEGMEYVRANFSYDAQVRKLFTELLPKLAADRSAA